MDLKYSEPGHVLHLFDVRTGRLIAEYKRTVNGINFTDFIKAPREVQQWLRKERDRPNPLRNSRQQLHGKRQNVNNQ
jgi:hypothetical protein